MYAKRPIRLIAHVFMLALCLPLMSCGDAPTLDPPEVRWGQDVCAECGMILSDDRYAAAVVAIHDGQREVFLYDDVGEMLAHPPKTGGDVRYWARDMRARGWIDATSAHYVRAQSMHTPMGYGVAALTDPREAQKLRDETDGQVLTYAELSATGAVGNTVPTPHHHAPHSGDKP